MIDKIIAVVVTYNRLPLLKKCIYAIINQTHKLNTILVINNGSTDGTENWLNQQSEILVIHQSNLGGAGGFENGLKTAYENGYDWVWMMDDDAFPKNDCLENMLKSKFYSDEKNVVLAPLVIEGDKIDHTHRGQFDRGKIQSPLQIPLTNADIINNENEFDVSFISFIGMLIGSNVIKKVGYPYAKYFIFHDDVEYSLRIKSNNFSMYLIKNAIIFHKITNDKTKFDIHTYISNPMIIPSNKFLSMPSRFKKKLKTWNTTTSISKKYIFTFIDKRNLIHTIILHYGFGLRFCIFLLKDIFNSIGNIFFSNLNRKKTIALFFIAYKQGLTGNFNTDQLLNYEEYPT